MKLHLTTPGSQNLITAYGEGYVRINQNQYEKSLVLLPDRVIEDWQPAFDELEESHFEFLSTLGADIVLLGTGARQRFPHPRLTRLLGEAGVGLEVMDTRAACRTYNILMSEGRKVLAVLLLDNG